MFCNLLFLYFTYILLLLFWLLSFLLTFVMFLLTINFFFCCCWLVYLLRFPCCCTLSFILHHAVVGVVWFFMFLNCCFKNAKGFSSIVLFFFSFRCLNGVKQNKQKVLLKLYEIVVLIGVF